MVYPNFHQPHPEGADVGTLSEPIFHGTDNSTLYEDPYQGLLRQIIAANDIAALRLYQASPHSRVFWEEYEILVWYPFLVTKAYGSCDALRILLKIYLSDPVYQMPEFPPLAEYMVRWKFSPIHMACAATDRDLTIWLLSKRQRNPDERPLATLWDPGNGYDAVKWLLDANPDTINARDQQGAMVFNYAVKSRAAGMEGILAAVKVLLNAKPRSWTLNHLPDEKTDRVGTTAAATGTSNKVRDERFTELIETFLEHGADTRLCVHRLCAGTWHDPITLSMLDRLLEPPTDINDTDADGCTAMHYLVRHLDQIEAARHLISRGADELFGRLDEHRKFDHAQPKDAPARAREEWIKALVEAGGSMHQPNAAGQTPAQLLDELNERGPRNRQAEAARERGRGRGRS
ncbi:hypothetical protein PEBR_42236 [Penicillium brasilianum]|uniref:Uncharacterized protein n=1 Tax=Penicillium brasilianum TaxID=104259 RepID=A0A1S9R8I3_PENBI|nr:hypothetical protein PEBR_42236 [Penicillium brasilianum]